VLGNILQKLYFILYLDTFMDMYLVSVFNKQKTQYLYHFMNKR